MPTQACIGDGCGDSSDIGCLDMTKPTKINFKLVLVSLRLTVLRVLSLVFKLSCGFFPHLLGGRTSRLLRKF